MHQLTVLTMAIRDTFQQVGSHQRLFHKDKLSSYLFLFSCAVYILDKPSDPPHQIGLFYFFVEHEANGGREVHLNDRSSHFAPIMCSQL